MAIRWAIGGGNFEENATQPAPGLFLIEGPARQNNLPAGRSDTYGWTFGNGSLETIVLGSFTTLVAGCAIFTQIGSGGVWISMLDSVGNNNCDVRVSPVGILSITRNGTTLATGTVNILTNVWVYVELKVTFATGATGSASVQVNGQPYVSVSSVQTATTNANGGIVNFVPSVVGGAKNIKDMYVLDGDGGQYTTFLGDVNVLEIYANGAGTNSQWSQATNNGGAGSPPPFAITSVAGGNVFTRTVTGTGEANNAYQGYYFVSSGFTGSNGPFLCTASTTTTITLSGSSLTGSGSLAFQAIVQAGIQGGFVLGGQTTNVGTRPNGDVTYITDQTAGHLQDYTHQTLSFPGSINGVIHLSNARKDDAGTRQIAQITVQGGSVTETGATITLGNTYTYFLDVLELDPNTGLPWTTPNFNNAHFGVKELT